MVIYPASTREDICQALGIMPDRKYEADGGPGLGSISKLLRSASSVPLRDLAALVRVTLFNVIIGNCDAHGKNFSLPYGDSGIVLAPFSDLVSTMAYPELSTELSMKIGGEYKLDKIGMRQFEGFAKGIGVRPRLVRETLNELVDTFPMASLRARELPELRGHLNLIDRIVEGWNERAARLREAKSPPSS